MRETENQELLTHASDTLLAHRDEIAQQWACLVRQNIDSAAKLSEFVLYNFFPNLIEQIAAAIEYGTTAVLKIDKSSSPEEHGGERARLTRYNIKQVAGEFHYLKYAIFHVLDSNQGLTKDVRLVIDQIIDATMQRSLTGFALAESAIREQFVAMLAHDIRGSVAFMKMAVDLIREDNKASTLDELLGRMESASTGALELIDNILDTSALTANRRIILGIQQVNIVDVIEESIKHFEHEIQVQGQPVEGYWCPKGMSRAFKNVIDNALKYGDRNRPITISFKVEYDAIKISIHNDGSPIPPEDQEFIFQPHWRAKERNIDRNEGWGFGLPIVRGVVEAHGGTMSIESAEDHGTTVILAFPLDARPYQNPIAGS